jgi:hypothetical protein
MYCDVFPLRTGGNLPGTPYFAFSDYYGQGYDRNPLNPGGACVIPAGVYTQFVTGNTANLPNAWTVSPFTDIGGRWMNTGSVQIVSAGANSVPGPGGQWIPGQGAYASVNGGTGGDDQANFASAMLGARP